MNTQTNDAQQLVGEGGPRNKTHGDFSRNALLSQRLKDLIWPCVTPDWSYVARESIDMICLKLSRILSGMISEPDHWRDIAGYAQLVVDGETYSSNKPPAPFAHIAEASQELKAFVSANINETAATEITFLQREALDIICHSLAHIITGDVNYKGHWARIVEAATEVTNDLVTAAEKEELDETTETDPAETQEKRPFDTSLPSAADAKEVEAASAPVRGKL